MVRLQISEHLRGAGLTHNQRDDAELSNQNCRRDFFKKGTMSYAEAVKLWIEAREGKKIVRYA